jgi:hypothetical protein
MQKSKNRSIYFICFSVFIFITIFLINSLLMKGFLNFGKDQGLVFRVLFTCTAGGILFTLRENSNKIWSFIPGIFMGILSYIITFIIYLILPEDTISDIPILVDQLIATSILFLISIIVLKPFRR